jgi:hypothetical protein
MIISKLEMMDFSETESLPETQRNEDGFGSTGVQTPIPTEVTHGGINKEAFEKFKQEQLRKMKKMS